MPAAFDENTDPKESIPKMTMESFETMCQQKVDESLKSARKQVGLLRQQNSLYRAQLLHDLTASMMTELRKLFDTGVIEHQLDPEKLMTIIRRHFNRYYNEIIALQKAMN
jgi:hypothetical protein